MVPSTPIAYCLITLASVMFGMQFIFQQKYSREEGTSVNGALRFSLFGAFFQIPLVLLMSLVIGGLKGFNLATMGICTLMAFNNILNAYFCVKVFESADMTLFSIFEMLGGMTLPFIAGMVFFHEAATLPKFIGFALIALSLVLETGKASPVKGKAVFYYAGLFISNGMAGVYSKLNQSLENGAEVSAYIIMYASATIVICSVALLFNKSVRKQNISFANSKTALFAIAPYIVVATLGSFFLLTALETLPASVQYPMSTGGTIVVSAIISTIQREKLKPRNYIAAAIAVASAIIIAL